MAEGRVAPAVAARLDRLLDQAGAPLDATYLCPHHPDWTGPCRCRKPGLELFQRAAIDLSLELSSSIWIGDHWRDVEPSRPLGGRGFLISDHQSDDALAARAAGIEVVTGIAELMDRLGLG